MMVSNCSTLLIIVAVVVCLKDEWLVCGADPTDGFSEVPLTDDTFDLQKPFNTPLSHRYNDSDGIHSFWVYTNDKPFKPGSSTRPRTEVRIKGHDYSSGIWQFEVS
ncbi:Citrate-binding protein [Hibiscus syriacus]|uniref:Citrate-binding protein n=1 Tax=Hibiscus syriacus TaxID=106335 RepID=A0A6A2YSB6_HIBSY|nr:Citrate-binding protein [Hibiscus syriacus]